jgi:hypothetical protein
MAHGKTSGRNGRWLAIASAALVCAYFAFQSSANAGGPVLVTGAASTNPGSPFVWNLAALPNHAVQYTLDSGPLSVNPFGTVVISHSTGATRVQQMFQTWQNVRTSLIAFQNSGPLQCPSGFCAGGSVQNVSDFNAVVGTCTSAQQTPIIFDSNGSLVQALIGDPLVIGFEQPCDQDQAAGHILSGLVLLNGSFQDGVSQFQLTTNEFNQAFVHEFGHLAGLDHSQINVDVLNAQPLNCSLDEVAGLPIMFPVEICQDRVTAGLPPLSPDDTAWISMLYPVPNPAPSGKTPTNSAYGYITGQIFFSDGVTPAQGVNVVARQVQTPGPQNQSLRNAVSAVSGYLFTGDPGQSVTCSAPDPTNSECNVGGSTNGSRNPAQIGSYTIPVPASPAVQWTVNLESINPGFTGGSSLGPLDPPIPVPGQSPVVPITVAVQAGQTVTVDITLLNTPSRFDSFESAILRWHDPLPIWDDKRLPSLPPGKA